ncbi:Xylulose kinase [Roseibacterium elongatum DSM 19469]|uniref:Xylulose kinase n=2 Tax=Roseicyclus elongatus TaxID=159346 RepID=W8SKU3_9RHOB|nr:Xylulose kinase [Roseibacterium elongatum DSM 19469]
MLRAIGLSGQMHGAVLLDAEKTPIRPAILWNDGRAEAECADMARLEPEIGHLSGAPPMPGFTAPKLLWLSRFEPRTHARIAHVLLPKDYVGFRLHGGLVTDPSDAAGTGWFDEGARCWSSRLCEISASDLAWLPEVRHGSDVAGTLMPEVARELGLPAGIPVATGAGDAAAGAVGIGAIHDGDGFISLGTSGQLFVTTNSYRPDPENCLHAYAHCLPKRWFQMAAMLNGARPLAWFSTLVGRTVEELLAEAEVAAPGPLFLPYLTGERTPHGDASIRAGFAFLDESTTQGSLMRSVVEAVAFTFVDAVDAFSATGTRPDALMAIGGGTRSDFLMQMIADATGCRLVRTRGAEVGPAFGAARLAQLSLREVTEEVLTTPPVDRAFRPNRASGLFHSERLAAFRALYPALKGIDRSRQ